MKKQSKNNFYRKNQNVKNDLKSQKNLLRKEISQNMKDLNNKPQPRTKIQQATNSTSDSNKDDNSKPMQEKYKLTVFELFENQAANESPFTNFLDRYRTEKLRIEKSADSLGIIIAKQNTFRLGKHSSNNPKEQPLFIKNSNH